MADNKDAVRLAEYCFNVCEVVKTTVEGRDVDDFNGSVKMALEDLGRYVK